MRSQGDRWSKMSFYEGMTTEEYRACYDCNGNEADVWNKENPEVCSCDDLKGYTTPRL